MAISYASTLTAQSNAAGTLTFTPAMGEGTDDCYSGLLFSFQPISGYDEQMTKGSAPHSPSWRPCCSKFWAIFMVTSSWAPLMFSAWTGHLL